MPGEHAFEIEVRLERRQDGGLRASSPDVPFFVLSHSSPEAVLKNVVPALEGLLSHRLNAKVSVAKLVKFGQDSEMQPSPAGVERYASRIAA